MDGTAASVEVLPGLAQIPAEVWDACAAPECAAERTAEAGAAARGRPRDPFTTHRFLHALEASVSVGPGTGWRPMHLVARIEGTVVAVAPLYAKSHSMGEYIFDHAWAQAFEEAGGRYYPKLQIAVPFTPATGRRFLTRPGWEAPGSRALVEAAIGLAADNGLSSLHVTFCTAEEAERGAAMGLLRRASQQFHWINEGYRNFDDFLSRLSSRKRKAIRRERARAAAFGGRLVRLTGDDIRPRHWDAFWRFYQDTGARKWGRPYLTREFFDRVHQTMREDVLLVLAIRDGQEVAGALNFIGRDALFGRYWGAVEHHPFLHFECCYHQAIEFAIEAGLGRVEAGAQGAHKLARGYMPVVTHSLHWIAHRGFRAAVARFLDAERIAVEEENRALEDFGPFRKIEVEEQQ